MAAYVELYMDQGASFSNIININDDLTNSDIDISGYSVTSQMRRSYYSSNASANITCTITDAPSGEITLSMTPQQTANIKAGRYLFDVMIQTPSSGSLRLLEGIITVTPRVTK
jgi:hypothetical protein